MSKLHDTNPSEWLAVPGVSKRLLPMVQKWLWRHHWQGLDDKSLSKAIALALNPGCDFLGKPKVGYSERLHRIDELIKINNENKENLELLRNLKMYYHHNLVFFSQCLKTVSLCRLDGYMLPLRLHYQQAYCNCPQVKHFTVVVSRFLLQVWRLNMF